MTCAMQTRKWDKKSILVFKKILVSCVLTIGHEAIRWEIKQMSVKNVT
jgi:hypothetical protein